MMLKDEFVIGLVQEIVQAIAEGSRRIVVWGIKEGGLGVLSTLHSMGLISFVSGIIDSGATAQREKRKNEFYFNS